MYSMSALASVQEAARDSLQGSTPDSIQGAATAASGLTGLLATYPALETTVWVLGVLLLAWLANRITRRYILKAISRFVTQTRFGWDDVILKRKVFRRLAQIAPAMVIYYGAQVIPGIPGSLVELIQRVAMGYIVLVLVLSVDGLLTALNDLYSERPDAKSRPIKGYLQIVKIGLYIAAGIVVLSTLIGQPPTLILGGFGAMTAVLLLVFKDTILSLVASIQITQYDMIAVGDWIEMPEYGADGDVIDIALHTIKVQNWDKTITTIPTYKFIEDSFKNWRGMSRSGGRRVKRALYLDTGTIRFLTDEEIQRLGRFELLRDYLRERREEIETYNAQRRAALGKDEKDVVIPNARRLTNVGTLRAYIVAYLRSHPMVHQTMTLIVRQLQSGPTGLPLEVYVFCNDTNWVKYEGFQSDLFDHLFAMVPEFGLRVFQNPSGEDVRSLGAHLSVTS